MSPERELSSQEGFICLQTKMGSGVVRIVSYAYGEKSQRNESMRRLGGTGALATLLTVLLLAVLGGVSPNLDKMILGILLGLFFFFSGLFLVSSFTKFDRQAYPVVLLVIVVSLLIMVIALILPP